jgi:hypothetical protein
MRQRLHATRRWHQPSHSALDDRLLPQCGAPAVQFNLWGATDLLYAFYQGLIGVGIDPAALGAAFYIPTLVVPPLLVTHAMIFWLLLRAEAQTGR